MTKIGFVGIGTMGAPMVHCLAQGGFNPSLFDSSGEAAKEAGARDDLSVAETLTDLGRESDIVILMLPNSAIVRSVCMGDDGLAQAMSKGSVIVDMSSSDPIETRKLGAELADLGITLLDAPVSGGVRKAIAGTLAIILGGDNAEEMERVTPILESMGTVFRAGPLAAGHATKALNNYVSAAGLTAACEAVIIGREFGLDPECLTQIINASTGRNNSTENKVVQFILSGEFQAAGFGLGLMAKDVGLAASLSEHVGKPLPGVRAASDTWRAADTTLGKGADHTEIYRYLAGLK
ncbi:MAG: NAD(P)-dependent oxidoreductase [Alphaproteobacteria bacterium]|nr:NAD(P)-dependent oxidoreductase [Alphaproteobacteria bacterium]